MKLKSMATLLSLLVVGLQAQAEVVQAQQAKTVKTRTVSHKINLNTADLTQLTGALKGIGKKRAQAIIDYREEHKGFKSVDELAEVKGIGSRFMAKNQDQLKEIFAVN